MSVTRNIWQDRLDKVKARAERRKSNRRFIAKTKGRKALPSRKTLRQALDQITSMIVRMRDKKVKGGLCLVCCAKKSIGFIQHRPENPIELGYHVVRRGKEAVRWNLDNVVGACSACNYSEKYERYQNPDVLRRVHVALLGEAKLSAIEATARAGAKFDTFFLRDLLEERRAMLAKG